MASAGTPTATDDALRDAFALTVLVGLVLLRPEQDSVARLQRPSSNPLVPVWSLSIRDARLRRT